MDNYTNMSFEQSTRKSLFGYRRWIITALVCSVIADLVTFIYLAQLTAGFGYAVIPLVLAVVGIAFGILSYFVIDYRYSYSVWFAVAYSALQTVGILILLFCTGANVDVTMSTTAYLVYAIVHIVTIVVFNVVAYTTNKLDKKSTKIGAFMIALALIFSIGSIVYTCIFGFFGQNIGIFDNKMVLVYEKNEDGYTVKNVLYGRGDIVVIEDTFNGEKITAIDSEMFTKYAIKTVSVNTKTQLRVVGIENLPEEIDYMSEIKVPLDNMDYYRKELFEASNELGSRYALALCNQVTFDACPDNKVVVSFNYNFANLPEIAKNNFAPTIILNKGETLNLKAYASQVPYFAYIEPENEAGLKDAYYLGNGYFLNTPLLADGAVLDGAKITESVETRALSFERVYLIDVLCGNDGKYVVPSELSSVIKDEDKGKLIKHTQLDSYLSELPNLVKREGFDVLYNVDGKTVSQESILESLAGKNNTTIVPLWTIHTPKILSIDGDREYVYGDPVATLTVMAESVHELKYRVKDARAFKGNGNVFILEKPTPGHSFTYTFEVYIDDPDTELSVMVSQSVGVVVNKKVVTPSWTIPENAVYNEQEHIVGAVISESDMAFEDSNAVEVVITDKTTSTNSTNNPVFAGSYSTKVSFVDESLKSLYEIENDEQEFEISQFSVEPVWSHSSYVYNGLVNVPTVVLNGVSQVLSSDIVADDSKDAGNYTISVVLTEADDQRNYKIVDDTHDYEITPKVINVLWGSNTYEYVGETIGPLVTGFEDDSLCAGDTLALEEIKYTGLQRNVGTGYVATAVETFRNYDFSEESSSYTFSITAVPLQVNVENKSSTYDGKIFDESLSITADGLCGTDTLASVISQFNYGAEVSSAKNVGDYTIELSPKTEGANYSNYVITYQTGQTLTINQRRAIVNWTNKSPVYNGVAQKPTATVIGAGNVNLTVSVTGEQTNAGAGFQAAVSLTEALDLQNYYIETADASCTFEIKKRPITITANSITRTYDKLATDSALFGYTYNGLAEADSFSDVASDITYNDVALDAVNVSTYTIQMTVTLGTKANNYEITKKDGTLTIEKALATVGSLSQDSFIYNAQTQAPAVSITGVGGESVAHSLYALSAQGNRVNSTNVGTYKVELVLSNDNYKLPTTSLSFTIEKAKLTVNWGADLSFEYDGTTHYPEVELIGANDTVVAHNQIGGKNVGGYTSVVSIKNTLDSQNYYIDEADKSRNFEVTPATATINWGNLTFIYTGEAQYPAPTITGVGGEAVKYTVSTVEGTPVNAETYTARVELKNDNYVLDSYTMSYTISQRKLNVAWSNLLLTYNGGEQLPSAILTDSRSGAVVAGVIEGAEKNVGTYTATVSIKNTLDIQNYYIESSDSSRQFEIAPAKVTVAWDYDAPYTYNGSVQRPTAIATGINGESLGLSVEYTNEESKNAGDYSAIASITNTNYELDEASKTQEYTINKKSLTITADNKEMDYTGNTYQGTFTVKAEGLVGDDTLEDVVVISFTGEATTAKEVGSYDIVVSCQEATGGVYDNYEITTENGTLTINQVVSEANS